MGRPFFIPSVFAIVASMPLAQGETFFPVHVIGMELDLFCLPLPPLRKHDLVLTILNSLSLKPPTLHQ